MPTLLPWATLAALCLGLPAQSPLSTLYHGENSGAVGGAVYFDLTAQASLTVTAVDVHVWAPLFSWGTIDVYRCPGTHVGNESNAAVWTLIGSGTVTSEGLHEASPLTLANPITIPAGRYGYAYVAHGLPFAYTNASAWVSSSYETEELRLDAGAASNVPFTGPAFSSRIVNTTIWYADVGPGFARRAEVGAGCGERYGSFYEFFHPATAIDLSFTSFRLVPANGGYLVSAGGGTFVMPSTAATNLGLGDDDSAIRSISGVFTHPGGSTTNLEITSNGTVSAGPNHLDWQVSPATFLDQPHATWAVWKDFVPTQLGNVWFEEANGIVYVTFLDVLAYSAYGLGPDPNRFQLQFDTNDDSVTFVFENMDDGGIGSPSSWRDCLVGFSAGGPSLDPGSIDLGDPLLAHTVHGSDTAALAIEISARPIQGTFVSLETRHLSPGAILGGLAFGLGNPALDLASIGMPGCTQHADHAAVILFSPAGSPTHAISVQVPGAIGTALYCQSFSYDPAAGLTPLGVVASQGMRLTIGSF